MDRNAYRDDNGTGQPESYWRRRAITLAAGLTLVGLLAWAFSGGGGTLAAPAASSSRAAAPPAVLAPPATASAGGGVPAGLARAGAAGLPTASATRSPGGAASKAAARPASSAGSRPGGGCGPSSVVLSLFESRPSYRAGQDPQFGIYAVSTAAGTCTFGFGPGQLHLVVMSAGRVIWDSADCARGDDTRAETLRRGVPAWESVSWNRSITLPGCVTLASPARPGTYQAQARAGSVTSQLRTFRLVS